MTEYRTSLFLALFFWFMLSVLIMIAFIQIDASGDPGLNIIIGFVIGTFFWFLMLLLGLFDKKVDA